MKKVICAILSAAMLLAMCGCAKKETTDAEKDLDRKTSDMETEDVGKDAEMTTEQFVSMEIERVNEPVRIVDQDGKEIRTLENFGAVQLMDTGIFYMAVAPGDKEVTQYRIFDPESGEDKLLGEIRDQGYIASYSTLEVGGKIYTLTTVGDPIDEKPDTLLLLECDPETETMEKYVISEDGFPYAGMTEKDGRIVLFQHDQQETLYDRVVEFDPGTKEMKEILCFELPKDMVGESVRGISWYGGKLYVLTVRFGKGGEVRLVIHTYDETYQELDEYEISDAIAAVPGNDEALLNEMKQMVAHFDVLSETVYYYENFSSSAYFGDMGSGKLLLTAPVISRSNGMGEAYYRVLLSEADEGFRMVSEKDGNFTDSGFRAKDEGYQIDTISTNREGKILVGTCVRAAERMEHPEKVDVYYYLDAPEK